MAGPDLIPEPILRAASDWLVARCDGGMSLEDQRQFEQWLRADPLHAAAYAKLQRVWGDVSELAELAPLASLDDLEAIRTSSLEARQERARRWRRPLALAASLVAAVAATLVFTQLRTPDIMRTELAEVREFELSDGSVVTLGARSTLDLEFTDAERRVVLRDGEAFFRVAKDAVRPFIVEAGGTQARAVGTQFDVRRGAQGVTVAVVEGVVAVSDRLVRAGAAGAAEPRQHMLTAGQRTEIRKATPANTDPGFEPRPVEITPVSIETASAWRYGRLVYEDRPLEELVADVNRYYTPGVELSTPSLGALPVTAAFRVDEIPQTFAALAQVLPVTAALGPDGRIVLHAKVTPP